MSESHKPGSDSKGPASAFTFDAPELPPELGEYLSLPGSHALIVWGPTGSGKSTLSVELLRRLNGTLIMVTPAGIGPDERLTKLVGRELGSTTFQVTMPVAGQSASPPTDEGPGSVLAAGLIGPEARKERPPWIDNVLQRVDPNERTYIVIDHWRPRRSGSEGSKSDVELLSAGADWEIQALRVALEGSRAHLILLADLSPTDDPVSSVDGAIQTGYESLPVGRMRVLTLQKLRGVSVRTAQYPYSLDGGRFRCAMPLSPDFRANVAPPDPPTGERVGYIWPGSTAFARVFGWLRVGAFSTTELGPFVPDYVVSAISAPLIAHVLRVGGRVVLVPLPSVVPEVVVETLTPWLSSEVVRNGLRILSAGGDDTNPILREILLPLGLANPEPAGTRGSVAPRVAPGFPEAFAFLRGTSRGCPAAFVMSVQGLHAVSAVTGVRYEPATFPAVIARYGQLPGFHGFAFSPEADPLGAAARDHADRIVRADARHGRVFLTGVRPETLPHVLSWGSSDPRFDLVPMT